MLDLIKKAEQTHALERDELAALLEQTDEDVSKALYQAADRVRAAYVGSDVQLRGLIEFTNFCRNNCLYCGIRRDNPNPARYRLTPDQIVDFATKAASYGFKTVVLQGGEDPWYSADRVADIVRRIKKLDIAVTLSIGERTYEEYKAYRDAGADRYLIRIETTDKALYERLDPQMSWDNRRRCLEDLRRLGYEVGSGSMVGLPDQTTESIADDILFFKELNVDMAGIGPFIPHPDTPLKDCEGRKFDLALKTMALTRLLLPDINIPATTAMETLNPNGRVIALRSGANVVMPNMTEGEYRRLYELYPGKICVSDTPLHCRTCIGAKILAIGRTIGANKGFRGEFLKRKA